jgi:SWI/SNF-related matrix-associated actin-dependent regulator of chromatin subfamily A member 5
MPKEDRSDWVAVESDVRQQGNDIRKAQSAYQFFQKDVAQQIRQEYGKVSDIAEYGRIVKQKWDTISQVDRERYQNLNQQDLARFAQESHQADVAALERRERLLRERNTLLLDEKGGRMTREGRQKNDKKKNKKKKKRDKDHQNDDDHSASSGSWDSTDSDASKNKKKKAQPKPRTAASQKQVEYRDKVRLEKLDKDAYIAGRQEDLRRERSSQAKRRLEYLLKQGGNIFSHFGTVKADTAKYGLKKTPEPKITDGEVSTRRGEAGEEEDEAALEEADEHEATFLTAQPTTLGFGKMRDYQLEGLNWMIRLQENGVNGILADGTSLLGSDLACFAFWVF